MIVRRLTSVYYLAPTICCWDEQAPDGYCVTFAVAWLDYALEFTIGALHG